MHQLVAISLIVLSSIAYAKTIDEVDAAFKSGDYPQALRILRGLASKNDVEAQYRLGALHESGTNISQSYIEAVKCYRLAATGSSSKAQYSLASMYLNGLGVPQDFTKAHVWFNLAAIWGNSEAASSRESVAKRMLVQQVAEAKRLQENAGKETTKVVIERICMLPPIQI